MAPTAVYLEVGRKRVFACAFDWPGWCRPGKDEAAALAALADWPPRYATRRLAWHTLDHAWEMQDRGNG